MQKVVIFAFRGDPMCFIHVLLNALDLAEQGMEGKIVLEGEATKLLPELLKPQSFLHPLWQEARQKGLVEGVCLACSTKMGTRELAEKEGLPLLNEMKGHPSMGRFMAEGYQVLIL
ncbi:MAG: cytoplasmic protein [Thermodesulfatator sp.]|nr:MAG: cytoplasmic protein [Thermodesulfatator sp.]